MKFARVPVNTELSNEGPGREENFESPLEIINIWTYYGLERDSLILCTRGYPNSPSLHPDFSSHSIWTLPLGLRRSFDLTRHSSKRCCPSASAWARLSSAALSSPDVHVLPPLPNHLLPDLESTHKNSQQFSIC